MAAALESGSSPASSPLGPGGGVVSVTHSRSMTSRLLLASGPLARRLACRRRALEKPVKKVVTTHGTGTEPVTRNTSSTPYGPEPHLPSHHPHG
jgi:hypothetical protein